jgi:dihydroorotate dehydrogenase electron transfer subunit
VNQVIATVVSKGNRIIGLSRPNKRTIMFSQTIRLNCPEIAKEAEPGQFVMVRCGQDCILPRPFSVHQVINREDLVLYFAVLEGGKGTDWLSRREEGDTVELLGPLGKGFSIYPSSRKLLLVAGGMGVASLYFLADETFRKGYSVKIMYGTAIENPYPIDHLTSGIESVIATEDGSVGYRGMIIELVSGYIEWADQVFACGPLPMYMAMAQMPELKNRSVQVSLEMRMGCGLGTGYACTIRTRQGLRQVCKDGPVFELNDIIWEEIRI